LKAAVNAAATESKKARDELTTAYESLVKTLTMDKKITEAKAIRLENEAVATASGKERSGNATAQKQNANRDIKKVAYLSDLRERDVVVGWGRLGKQWRSRLSSGQHRRGRAETRKRVVAAPEKRRDFKGDI
jgi:hypothetical protein